MRSALPEVVPEGTYDLHFNYRTEDGAPLILVATAPGQLTVVGRFAKYGAPFGIADVVAAIDLILNGVPDGSEMNIADVVSLIDHLLEQ